MNNLTVYIKNFILSHGADLIGFGNITELPPEVRHDMPVGICVAVKYPDDVIQGISDLPTAEYHAWYNKLNERLDFLVTQAAEELEKQGYKAVAMTRDRVGYGEKEDTTLLPHKTVATRAGIGWIGKSALLVTDKYGSMIRLSSILTDAPLETAEPVNLSKCGGCMACTNACPGGAVSGKEWSVGLYRDKFFNSIKCREAARERSKRGFGGDVTICGKCIEVCPYTRKAWENNGGVKMNN